MLEILEVCIGLCLFFFLLSIVCSAITEMALRLIAVRRYTLRAALREMIPKENRTAFFTNLQIKSLFKRKIEDTELDKPWADVFLRDIRGWPSKIPSNAFATSWIASRGTPGSEGRDEADAWQSDPEKVAKWYDDSMVQVSERFRRWTQNILFGLTTVIVVSLNADALFLAQQLWINDELREAVVDAAIESVEDEPLAEHPGVQTEPTDNRAATETNTAQEPGWGHAEKTATALQRATELALFPRAHPLCANWLPCDGSNEATDHGNDGHGNDDHGNGDEDEPERSLFRSIVGWGLTVFCVSLGAPFWYDLMGKLVRLRLAVNKKRRQRQEDGADDPGGDQ